MGVGAPYGVCFLVRELPLDERAEEPGIRQRQARAEGELGTEGFQTVLRLGGGTAAEVKRILFRAAPREE